MKIGGHDAGDRVRRPVENQFAAQRARVAMKFSGEKRGAQHRDRALAGLSFHVFERAAQRRAAAQQAEKAGGDARSYYTLGTSHPSQVFGRAAQRFELLKAVQPLFPFEEIASGYRNALGEEAFHLRIRLPEHRKLRRLAIRQRTQQSGFENAENSGVCPRAERQSEHRGRDQRWIPAKTA